MNISILTEGSPDSTIVQARLAEPYKSLCRTVNARIEFFSAKMTASHFRRLVNSDVIVIQRDFVPFLSAAICNIAHEKKIPVIHEIDDLLTDPPVDHPDRNLLAARAPFVRWLLKRADGLTVSTHELKRRLARSGQKIAVVPACITRYPVRQPADKGSSPVRIGFAGTSSHQRDLDMLKDACIALDRELKTRIVWCFYGCVPSWAARLSRVRFFSVETTRKAFFMKWGRIPFHIGLAPLCDTAFNRSKDAVKYFDYTHMGAVGIYSGSPAIRQHVRNGQNGLIVSGHGREWQDAVRMLISDVTSRHRMLKSARTDIRRRRKFREMEIRKSLGTLIHSLNPATCRNISGFGAVRPGLPVWIYGTGRQADDLRHTLSLMDFNVRGYVETSPGKSSHNRLPVIPPSRIQVRADPNPLIAISSTTFYSEMSSTLNRAKLIYGKNFL